MCRSTDFGKTFGDGCESGQAQDQAGAEEDRQWLAHDPNDAKTVYFIEFDLAKQHLKLEPATITQEIRLDALKTMPSQQRRDAPLPSPPRTGNDVPSSVLPGGARVAAEAGSPSPASAPYSGRPPGPTTPPRPAVIQEPATSGPVGDGQSAAASIDEILSRNEGGHR